MSESRMTWGDPTGRYEDLGGGRQRYTPPSWNDAAFRGRAGVVIEIAPQQFVSYVMAGTHGEMEILTEEDEIRFFDRPEMLYVPTSRQVHLVLHGHLSSMQEQADRPAWATARHEIEARRELGRR